MLSISVDYNILSRNKKQNRSGLRSMIIRPGERESDDNLPTLSQLGFNKSEEMFLIHAGRMMDMRIYLSDIVEISMRDHLQKMKVFFKKGFICLDSLSSSPESSPLEALFQ